MLWAAFALFCVIHSSAFSDDIDLDLAGIFKFLFYLLGNITGEKHHIVIADFVGLDHKPDFSAGLDGVSAVNAVKARSDFFKFFKALDIVLNIFAPCAGSCRRYGIRSLNEAGGDSFCLNIAVMRLNRVNYLIIFFEFSCVFNAELNV